MLKLAAGVRPAPGLFLANLRGPVRDILDRTNAGKFDLMRTRFLSVAAAVAYVFEHERESNNDWEAIVSRSSSYISSFAPSYII